MRNGRTYSAGVILGATLVATVWLWTYRSWDVAVSNDRRTGFEAVRVSVHPWWAVLGAYCLPFIGAGASVWLLPEGRLLIERFVGRVTATFSAKPS